MRFTRTLFAVLAIIGLGQAHESFDQDLIVPGKGALRNELQDIFNLVPIKKIKEIALDYVLHDSEVQDAFMFLRTTTTIKDFLVDFEAIPQVIEFLDFLQWEGVDIYAVLNRINRLYNIKELEPPATFPHAYSAITERTGGLKGLFQDIMKQFNYKDFITIYVKKVRSSAAFVRLVQHLQASSFQEIVNRTCKIKSFQIIRKGLKSKGVNLQIVEDIMYLVLGITVPKLDEEVIFWKSIPMDQYVGMERNGEIRRK